MHWVSGILAALCVAGAALKAENTNQIALPATALNALQVHQITPAQAAQGRAVRVSGVVTYYDPAWSLLFLEDSAGGLFVQLDGSNYPIREGQRIEVEAKVDTGGFLPYLYQPRIKALDAAELPAARKLTARELATGNEDCLWVEVAGYVNKVVPSDAYATLEISDQGCHWTVYLKKTDKAELEVSRLVDAQVLTRGVCSVLVDDKRETPRIRLFVPGITNLAILKPAPAEPRSAAVTQIQQLKRLKLPEYPGPRVRVQGVVTWRQKGGELIVQDATGGLCVFGASDASFQVDEQVDALGFLYASAFSPELHHAIIQSRGRGASPAPAHTTPGQVLWGNYDGRLVQIQGTLLNRLVKSDLETLILQADGINFAAQFNEPLAKGALASLQPGQNLRVEGVCRLQGSLGSTPQSFKILLRSDRDLKILPPVSRLLTARQVFQILGVAALCILIVLTWVFVLRHKVSEQTALIKQRLEHEAALEQRYQELVENAHDIIYTRDEAGNFTSINAAGVMVLGYPREELLRMNMRQVVVPEQQEFLRTMLPMEMGANDRQRYELSFLSRQGAKVQMEVIARPIIHNGRQVGTQAIARDVTESKQLAAEREQLIHDLTEALTSVHTLRGLLPICAYCKKVRDDKGYWNQIEKYISSHSRAQFSHGICPDCSKKVLQDYEAAMLSRHLPNHKARGSR